MRKKKQIHFFIRSEQGQMAIFVALIFQVLFVFFAMAINIALVVHDKINLQNSVDLAAYYAASKQAEVLNAIAHSNYQIRQSWKLLAWRYRVLGTIGLLDHPTKSPNQADQDVVYPPGFGPGGINDVSAPALCVTVFPHWGDAGKDNLCQKQLTEVPPLPVFEVIAGFTGLNGVINAISKATFDKFKSSCSYFGAYNRWMALNFLTAYRMDQANRKQIIYALANNLSNSNSNDFKDLDGQSVLEGARKTFFKNLTHENFGVGGSNVESFEMYNSLSQVTPEQWLPEITVIVNMLYMDVSDANGCNATNPPKRIDQLPEREEARQVFNGLPYVKDYLEKFASFGEPESGIQRMSIGVEKNPWYMAYVGIKAKTKPRQVFFPFGPRISFEARGFAKPFGGRVGPWYSSQWSRSSQLSDGDKIDIHSPPRLKNGTFLQSQLDRTLFPNYSRFPGDNLGVASRMHQNALQSMTFPQTFQLKYSYLQNISTIKKTGEMNDILSWDYENDQVPNSRAFEIAALAPDLFDITYYSVFPNYGQNFLPRIIQAKNALGIPNDVPVLADLGQHGSESPSFSVQNQIEVSKAAGSNKVNLHRNHVPYFIRDKQHLLTSWVHPSGINDEYTLEQDRFGKCYKNDDAFAVKNVGSCVAGGRVGYSVKLVSKSALISSEHNVGGGGEPPGSILNPPPEDF